jgi:hypothetical protein
MLFNCSIVSALKHLFNGCVSPALHLFIEHMNDLIQLCFVFMSQVHMTLGRFVGARSQVFSSHIAQILSGHHQQQPKSAMKRSPSMATQICHEAVTVDGNPNLPWSSHCRWQPKSAMERPPSMAAEICHGADALEQPAMEQIALSPPWRGHLGAVRHGEGCLGTAMEQVVALMSPWSWPPWNWLPGGCDRSMLIG